MPVWSRSRAPHPGLLLSKRTHHPQQATSSGCPAPLAPWRRAVDSELCQAQCLACEDRTS